MADSSVVKLVSNRSPEGSMGQRYLASGTHVSMRLWEKEPDQSKEETTREYETVGYVLSGKAELFVEEQKVTLEEGDSWMVPAGTRHRYSIIEPFVAIEATAPPAHAHGRDL